MEEMVFKDVYSTCPVCCNTKRIKTQNACPIHRILFTLAEDYDYKDGFAWCCLKCFPDGPEGEMVVETGETGENVVS